MPKYDLPQTIDMLTKATRYQELFFKLNKTSTEITELASLQVELADYNIKASDFNALETTTGAQAKVNTHAAIKLAHDATSAATPNTMVARDAGGRFSASTPSSSVDVANKAYVDNLITSTQAKYNTILLGVAYNLNEVTATGKYVGSGMVNRPDASVDWFYVDVINHANTGWVTQTASSFYDNRVWTRRQANSVWGQWSQEAGEVSLDYSNPIPTVAGVTSLNNMTFTSGVSIGQYFYIFDNAAFTDVTSARLFRYDLYSNSWTELASLSLSNFSGSGNNDSGSYLMTDGTYLYFAAGTGTSGAVGSVKIYRYHIPSNVWSLHSELAMSISGRPFVTDYLKWNNYLFIRVAFSGVTRNDFYRIDIASLATLQLTTTYTSTNKGQYLDGKYHALVNSYSGMVIIDLASWTASGLIAVSGTQSFTVYRSKNNNNYRIVGTSGGGSGDEVEYYTRLVNYNQRASTVNAFLSRKTAVNLSTLDGGTGNIILFSDLGIAKCRNGTVQYSDTFKGF